MYLKIIVGIILTFNVVTPYLLLQDEIRAIKELAEFYGDLMMTFDPREVPLEDFFVSSSTQKEINDFNDVVIFIIVNLETSSRLSDVPMVERYTMFWDEVDQYITNFNFNGGLPFTFKLFQKISYSHFLNFDGSIKIKQIKMTDCEDYRKWKIIKQEQIDEALKSISYDFDRKTKKFSIFLPEEFFIGEEKDMKKGQWFSNHHMISSQLLRRFWAAHDKIFESMATREQKYKDRIMRHNQRKIMFPNLRTIHENTQKRRDWGQDVVLDEEYKEVLRSLQTLPPGLSFRGPAPNFRSDDPDKQKNIEIDSDLEENCGIIVGDDYLKKVIELKQRIEHFLKDTDQTVEKSSKMASRIMGMWVHRDYSKDKIILPWFSYNNFGTQEQWYLNTTTDLWRLKTKNEVNLTTEKPTLDQPGTSGYKKFTTSTTTEMPLLTPTVRSIGSLGWELKKKKRETDNSAFKKLKEMCEPHSCSWYAYLNIVWAALYC
jgi:hypothetical protein